MAVSAPAVLGEPARLGFEELYAAHQPRVYRTCLAILRNHDDAAEATQEVFSRALPLLTELREPQVWLTTVARNLCFDQLRRQKVRGPGVVLDEDTPGSRRDDPERETMLRDALRQAFDALSGRERRALARVLLMDDSLGDIAEMLGVSYGAAAQVVSRARRRAALAARAVVGASFAALLRLSLPSQRSKVVRTAAQALEGGQHIILAAAFVLTAGGLAHAEAVAPAAVGGSGAVQIAPVAAHPAAVDAPAAAPLSQAPLPLPRPSASSPLPPGYRAGPIGNNNTTGSGTGSGSGGGSTGLPSVPVQVATVYPTSGKPCAGADVAVGSVGVPAVACAH